MATLDLTSEVLHWLSENSATSLVGFVKNFCDSNGLEDVCLLKKIPDRVIEFFL